MAIHVAISMAMQRVEVITDGGRRRRYDEEEKLRLVRGVFSPGVKVAVILPGMGGRGQAAMRSTAAGER